MSGVLPERPKKDNVAYHLRGKSPAEAMNSTPKMVSARMGNHCQKLEVSQDRILNDTLIAEYMEEIHQLTIDLIGGIGKFVSMDQWSWPQVADTHIWFKELHELFTYGLGLEEGEKLDSAFRRLKTDTKEFSIYARMLIGVGIHRNIFVASWPDVPILDLNWAKQALKPLLEERPEYEQRLPTMLLKSLADDELLNAGLAGIPEKFGWQLLDDMIPMFVSFKDQSVQREHSSARTDFLWKHCGQIMVDIFRTALTLRLEMTFKGSEYQYSFFWPQAGQLFNEKHMDVEINQRRVLGSKAEHSKADSVIATLLPGICRVTAQSNDSTKKGSSIVSKARSQTSERPEKVIVPALVFLGDKIL